MEKKINKKAHLVLFVMIGAQLTAWAWFSFQGGELSDKAFLIFTLAMLSGQLAAGIETFILKSWGAFAAQVWFFSFTAWGGVVRYMSM